MDFSQYSEYEELISRYLSGETSDKETKTLMDAIKANNELKEMYEHYRNIWSLSDEYMFDDKINVDNALSDFMDRTFDKDVRSQTKTRSLIYYLSRVAAAIIVLVGGFFVLKLSQSQKDMLNLVSGNETDKEIKMQDGSIIKLNKNSEIKYKENFSKKREIYLTGEAFFEVDPDQNNDFVVHANEIDVRVAGTSFYVKAYTDSANTIVQVLYGSVEVTKKEDKRSVENKIVLEAKEEVQFNKKEREFVKKEFENENSEFWVNRKLFFKKATLINVIQKVNENYNVNIIFASEKIKECKLTANFSNKSITEILEVLQATFNLDVEKEDNKYILRGEGCSN